MASDLTLRQLLLDERASTAAQLAALTRSFDDIVAASELVSSDDEHDPEGATIAFERAQVAALRDAAAQHLADLDQALARADAGEHVRCEQCDGPIGDERQAALPATRRCVDCAV
jgi:RNA polymerase-binding transcription factor DksA